MIVILGDPLLKLWNYDRNENDEDRKRFDFQTFHWGVLTGGDPSCLVFPAFKLLSFYINIERRL